MISPKPADLVAEINTMAEEIRRLKLARADGPGWTWTPLRNYLCGGWFDAYEGSGDPNPAAGGSKFYAGYWDTGHCLIFTGAIQVDKSRLTGTPPTASPAFNLTTNKWPTQWDGQYITGPTDAYGQAGAPPADKGVRLPYRTAIYTQIYAIGQINSSNNDTWFMNATIPIDVLYNTSPAGLDLVILNTPLRGGSLVVDSMGHTHSAGVPNNEVITLEGLVLPYTAAL